MKQIQKVINDQIVDLNGVKRNLQVILGSTDKGYVQGTIFDANATDQFVTEKVDEVIGGASEALDTLKEAEDAINDLHNTIEDHKREAAETINKINEAAEELDNKLAELKDELDDIKDESGVTHKELQDAINEIEDNYVTKEELEDELYVQSDSVIVNGYEFVDLGLPSGTLWATCNIGANKPEECGWYFQWAGTIAYNSDRIPAGGGDEIDFFYNSDCPYWVSGKSPVSFTKWSKYTNDSYSSTSVGDDKLILDLEDDAAHVHIGGDSRMPTEAEFQELINACNTEWVENYNNSGINGRLLTLKTDSSKQLFFPAAGFLHDKKLDFFDTLCLYWSSSRNFGNPGSGWYLSAYSGNCRLQSVLRTYGQSVRPVLPADADIKSPKFLPNPSDGQPGQVLTKTEDGAEWKDTASSIENIIDGKNSSIYQKTATLGENATQSFAANSSTVNAGYSFGEGYETTVTGMPGNHAEGYRTSVEEGPGNHAEGYYTKCKGTGAHAEGFYTEANGTGEHASGMYNKSTPRTRFSIGIGTDETHRKNAFEVTDSGAIFIVGVNGYDGTNVGDMNAGTIQNAFSKLAWKTLTA